MTLQDLSPDLLHTLKGKAAVAITLLGAYVAWRLFYAVFLSPLHRVPGPLLAKLTHKWLLFVELGGTRTKTVTALHAQYGPVVQLSPTEVSFNAASFVDVVYGQQSDFVKADWYKKMTRGGVFNETNPVLHRQRRKLLNHAFSQASVNDMEPTMREQMQKLIDQIEKKRKTEPIDIRHWIRMLAFDISGAVFMGKSAGGLDTDETPQYVKDLDTAFLIWDLRDRLPLISRLLGKLPFKSLKEFFTSDDRIYEYGQEKFDDYVGRYGRAPQRKDFLTKLIRKDPNQGDGLTDEEVAGEITNLTFAATDTAALTMIFLFWELGQHPKLQDQLREELRQAPLKDGILEHKDLWNLPFLNAVINEALRKHPAVVMGLLRVVPPGGRELEGYFIPEKTWVSMSSYIAHRDPKAFPDPEAFIPNRWLEPEGGTEEMKRLFIPFTKGTRQCIGQAMALFEMRIIVATIVKRYAIRPNKVMAPGDMDFVDYFIMLPKAEKCLMDFVPVET